SYRSGARILPGPRVPTRRCLVQAGGRSAEAAAKRGKRPLNSFGLCDAQNVSIRILEPGHFRTACGRRPNAMLVLSRKPVVIKADPFFFELRHRFFYIRNFPSKNGELLRCE